MIVMLSKVINTICTRTCYIVHVVLCIAWAGYVSEVINLVNFYVNPVHKAERHWAFSVHKYTVAGHK